MSATTMDGMHPSVTRLFEAARRATADTKAPIRSFSDLQAAMGISPAVLTNWKARGVSLQGACEAEEAFGVSPAWVLKGKRVREPSAAATDPPQSLGYILARVPTDRRTAVAETLAGWAREAGADHWREMLETLLTAGPSGKRVANGN